ncbi:sulfotransferase [Solimonas flava]|uniref:sulfotransferase n=1 Tax=Solimonas flava TaxID=415849 RepID=UPI0003F53D68|nr:sulfotransferase [Solimonas flava]
MSAAPLFVVAAPFCGASRLAAALGAHPQLYAVPETNLFVAGTVAELLEIFELSQGSDADGLLRALAELEFGGEGDESVERARQWLAARADWPTPCVLEHLAARVAPRRLVVTETLSALRPLDLDRLCRAFPQAAAIQLVRHPWSHGALFAAWLADRLFVAADYRDHSRDLAPIDPQLAWLRVNGNVERVLAPVYGERLLRVRDEDFRGERLATLAAIARHAGVAADALTVSALQPQAWTFHGYGPPAAPYGLDAELLEDLVPDDASARLDGPLPWRGDGVAFAAEVVASARACGYGPEENPSSQNPA